MAKRLHKFRKENFFCCLCKQKLPKSLIWWRRNKHSNRVLPFCEGCLTANWRKKFVVYDNELFNHTILDRKNCIIVKHPKVEKFVREHKKKPPYVDICQLWRSEKPGRNGQYVYYWKKLWDYRKPVQTNVALQHLIDYVKYKGFGRLGRNVFKFRTLRQRDDGKWELTNVRIRGISDEKGHFSLRSF